MHIENFGETKKNIMANLKMDYLVRHFLVQAMGHFHGNGIWILKFSL